MNSPPHLHTPQLGPPPFDIITAPPISVGEPATKLLEKPKADASRSMSTVYRNTVPPYILTIINLPESNKE